MATKIIYRGKTHYWIKSVSTKSEAEKFASKRRKQNYSVVIKKLKTPLKTPLKIVRYRIYNKSLPKQNKK